MNIGVKDVMKKAKVTVAATALLAGATLAQTAHADEVDSLAISADEQQNQSVTTSVTQTDVENAKGELDKANDAVNNQNQVVNNAQQNANNAQDAIDKAQQDTNNAQDLVDKATPEEIENAMNGVTDSQNKVDQAKKDQEQAEQNVNNAQGAVNNVQNKVDQAQNQVNDAQNQVNDAQSKVDQAQDILDGTGSKDILDEAEAAKKAEATKKDDLESAKDQLEEAEKADKNRQDAIDKAQSELDKTEQELADKKTDLDQKTESANQAQDALSSAQKEFTDAKNDYDGINTITMSAEYAKALKDVWNFSLSKEEQDAAWATLKRLAETEAANNKYNHNENDKKVPFDINHITDEQAKELSLFMADLINQVRKIVGTHLVQVSQESILEALKQAQRYANSNMTFRTLNHNTAELETKYGWVDEDLAGYLGVLPQSGKVTFDDAKSYIYRAVVGWIFNDVEPLHATSVVGTRNATTGDSYIGASLSQLKDGSLCINLNIFNTVKSNLNNFDKTALVNPNSADNITATYHQAKAKYDTAKAKADVANQALAQAQSAYDNVQGAHQTAQTNLTVAQSVAVQTPAAQSHLVQAQDAYNQAQTRLEKANEAVANLNADIKQKKKNLDNAKQLLATKQADLQTKQEALTQAQATLTQLQADLVSAQNAVVTAKDNVEDAKEQLVQAQAYLESLQHAPERLAEAKEKEAMAKSNLVKALDQLEAELTTLEALQVKQLSAQTVYETTAKAYQDVLDAQHKQQLQNEYDALVSQGKTPVPIIDETGKIIGYQAETVQSTTTTQTSHQSLTPTANIPVQKASVLPTTGDKGSVLAVIVGSLLTLFGLVDIRRKQNSK